MSTPRTMIGTPFNILSDLPLFGPGREQQIVSVTQNFGAFNLQQKLVYNIAPQVVSSNPYSVVFNPVPVITTNGPATSYPNGTNLQINPSVVSPFNSIPILQNGRYLINVQLFMTDSGTHAPEAAVVQLLDASNILDEVATITLGSTSLFGASLTGVLVINNSPAIHPIQVAISSPAGSNIDTLAQSQLVISPF